MAHIEIDREKCTKCGACVSVCPFGAIEEKNGAYDINAGCKMCRLCIKNCTYKAISLVEEKKAAIDKDRWKGVLVFVEYLEGQIHPVTLELIGKARELAAKVGHPVYCLFAGYGIRQQAASLLDYGVDQVFVYDDKELEHFRVDVYANVFDDLIHKVKPSVVLVGGTSIGRSLAPRVATRFGTGLTADCTVLDIKENSDLIQIRPAFGGNIMARIVTPNTRPQFATVRYKVMDIAEKVDDPHGEIVECRAPDDKMASSIQVIRTVKKEKVPSITDAEVLVVAGRGVRDKVDLAMLQKLANQLGGQLAVTRPMVECGWADYTRQIGLSGRTVKPKLIITCGVSGAIQFTACMKSAECILSINSDKNAPIFRIAHYGIVGDLYEIVPKLITSLKRGDKFEK